VKPLRSLPEDMELQTAVMSYGGNGTTISLPPKKPVDAKKTPTAEPDFAKMTAAQKVAYQKQRWDRILG
jgi:hypothetical protein